MRVGGEVRQDRGGLQELHLLVFAEHEFRGFAPLGGVLPAVLDQARGMAVDLAMNCDKNLLLLCFIVWVKPTLEQLSQVNIVPRFFPPFVTSGGD